jgi:hypothetical protein
MSFKSFSKLGFIYILVLCCYSPFAQPVMKFDKIESPTKSPSKGSPSHG